MELVIALALLIAAGAFVAVPLRRARGDSGESGLGEDPRRADLEARKEALYRQIRDAELDRAQGKLSAADFERLDAELRREAIATLKQIDQL